MTNVPVGDICLVSEHCGSRREPSSAANGAEFARVETSRVTVAIDLQPVHTVTLVDLCVVRAGGGDTRRR